MPLRDHDPPRVGRYRLIARLGVGGMGVVYLGQDLDGSQVAVKVLRPELADDPEFRVRFGREVAALMRVRGTCTVRVIEADTDAPSPFMVTEYAEGPSLAEYLDSSGPLGPDMLYSLASGLAEALTAIHATGVVHRDLKPSNVILGRDAPKVIDFGIAHALGATHLTRTGMIVGSAGFMAPEQISGRAGQAADIFAWGVTIAHAASGQPPFGSGAAHAILYRIMYDEPDIAAVPEPLRALVASALAKDPERRPSAPELLDRLIRPSRQAAGRSAESAIARGWPATQPSASPRLAPTGPRFSPAPTPSAPSFSPAPARNPGRAQDPSPAPARNPGRAQDPSPAQSPSPGAASAADRARGSLLLGPASPGARRPHTRRRLANRRTALIAAPAVAAAAVVVMVVSLMTGHGLYFGQVAATQLADQGTGKASMGMYRGQQARGVFQGMSRIVASGSTMVTIGSQSSDGLVRQQFFVSQDGGTSWHLAPVRGAGGGQAPLGHPASLLAGGQGGWVAIGPQAVWASRDGASWTLAAGHGISPQLPGDSVWVITRTGQGYLAAGKGTDGAVLWTSRDGLAWQRATAARLGLAGPGETVRNISYATYHGAATVISGQVARGGSTYSGAWLSTDGGQAWTRVTIPADHGATQVISGLGFDAAGLLAVRPGRSASGAADAVAYFSPNGQAWQFAGTLGAAPGVVKGSDDGFVVTGTTAQGTIVAYTSTGAGGTWQQTGPLGTSAAESVVSATVAPRGTVVAVGYTTATKLSQQPLLLEADKAGAVRPVPVDDLPGALIPELSVNGLATAGGQTIAVGSADGYPAVWRKAAGGSWSLVSPLSLAAAFPGLKTLSSVTHGPAGWLAVGAPGPIVLTSADGVTWQQAGGTITRNLAGVSALAAASGPAGYIIVGKLIAPGGGCVADVWWSPDLAIWTRAHDVNDATGSSQVLTVAAGAHGFVSAGSHNGKPAVWTTTDGRSWRTIVLPVPGGAASGVLQQIAIKGNRVAALGQAVAAGGRTVPLGELSADGGTTWRQVPFGTPGTAAAFVALTAGRPGFTAAGQSGAPGRQRVAVWTSPDGGRWTQVATPPGPSQITALAPSGSLVTGVGSVSTQQSHQVVTMPLP